MEHVAPAPVIGYTASAALPVTLFAEQTVEQIVDLPVPPIVRDILEVESSSDDAADAASAAVIEYLAIECGSSLSSAACAAPASAYGFIEQLTSMCQRIEKETWKIAMFTQRCAEEPFQPSLTSPTDSEQAPLKRRRGTRYTPLPRVFEDTIFQAPDAWPLIRHALDVRSVSSWG